MQSALERGGKVVRRRRRAWPHEDKADTAHVAGSARSEPIDTRRRGGGVVRRGRAGSAVAFALKRVGGWASAR
jgi:hypothetical protein